MVRGFFDRHPIDMLIGAVMALCFAYQFTVLLPQNGIGWQAHIGGLVGGVAAGWIFRDRRAGTGSGGGRPARSRLPPRAARGPTCTSSSTTLASEPVMSIVDAHHHVWDLSVRDQPFLDQPGLAPLRRNFLLADLEPEAAAQGVTSTVVVQTVAEPGETPELLALAATSDLIAGVVGWVDLEAPDAADAIAALRQLPGGDLLVGIRHPVLTEPDPEWLARPAVLRGLAAVAAAGLVYDVVAAGTQLRAAVAAATATPQLTFVLDHLGNPEIASGVDESWASTFRAFAALPNTVGKFSGVLGELAARPGRPGGGAAAAALRDRDGRLRPGPAHVRLGLAGQHDARRLRRRVRGGASADGRPERDRAIRDLQRHGAANLPARPGPLARV